MAATHPQGAHSIDESVPPNKLDCRRIVFLTGEKRWAGASPEGDATAKEIFALGLFVFLSFCLFVFL
jgi:hypothetical protein